MNTASVFHLSSNDLAHPENTASVFRVHFDAPFNLSGKKIALVSTTLTKAEANVSQEAMTFTYKPRSATRVQQLHTQDIVQAALSSRVSNPGLSWQDFIGSFSSTVLARDSQEKLVEIKAAQISLLSPDPDLKKAIIKVKNLTSSDCEISFLTVPISASQNGWSLIRHAISAEIATSNYGPLTGYLNLSRVTIILKPKKTVSLTLDFITYKDEKLQNVSRNETSNNDLAQRFQFVVKAQSTKIINYNPVNIIIQPGPGHFSTIEDLLLKINKDVEMTKIGNFSYEHGLVRLNLKIAVKNKLSQIDFGGMERHIGFDEKVVTFNAQSSQMFVGQRPPDMTRGTHLFYIYCSLVKNVVVNNKSFQLLATIDATKGIYGEQIQHPVYLPLFVDCIDGDQQVIEITIANDMGHKQGLLMGRTNLVLQVQHK